MRGREDMIPHVFSHTQNPDVNVNAAKAQGDHVRTRKRISRRDNRSRRG